MFDEGVYGINDGTTALTADKLALRYIQSEGGSADAVKISSIKQNDNIDEAFASALKGGETTIRVFLDIIGTPNGLEAIEIVPANSGCIYDNTGNAMLTNQTTGVEVLNNIESY